MIFPPPIYIGRVGQARVDRLAFSTVPLSNLSHVLSRRLEVFFIITLAVFAPLASAHSATLTVAAASDLTSVGPSLTASFNKTNPTVNIRWVTAASGVLKQQIENGAPYDVFLSANARYLDELLQKGLIRKNSAVDYAQGELGIVWNDHASHPFSDLRNPDIRLLALPNPKLAPYGVAAQQALTKLGLWPAVQSKITYGENVQQTWQLFESGNADAVITSWSILYNRGGSLIDPSLHGPIIQRGGIVTSTPNLEKAQQFLKFLTGSEGIRILTSHGLRARSSNLEPATTGPTSSAR